MYKKAANTFIVNSFGLGLSFLFQLFLAKALGDQIYGEANYYFAFANTIVIFTYFGVQMYIAKNVQFAKDKKEFFSKVVSTISLMYILIIPIVYLFIKSKVSPLMFMLLIALSYFMVMTELVSSYYLGVGKPELSVFLRKGLPTIIQIAVFIVIAVLMPITPTMFIIIMLISNFFVVIPIMVKNFRKIKFSAEVVRSCWKFYVTQVFGGIYIQLSKILQERVGGFGQVAVLSVSLTLGNIVNLFGDTFSRLAMPIFSKAYKENDQETIKNTYRSITKLNSYLVLPLAIAILINSKFVLGLLGEGYTNGVLIFQMVLMSQILNSFTGPNGTLLNMSNNETYEVYNAGIKFGASLLIGFWLGPKYYFGFALAIAVGEVLISVIKTFQVKSKFGFLPFSKPVIAYILGLTAVELVIYYFLSKLQGNFILFVLANGIVTVIVYLATFYFSPDKEDKENIKKGIVIAKEKSALIGRKIKRKFKR